jgi:solute carrier family 15 oligopeptide transporter 1
LIIFINFLAVEASGSNGAVDAETQQKQYKYPFQIFFIVINEFCERFNYYGMRTILALYLTRYLDFSDDQATIIYHSFTVLVYFFCIPGGTKKIKL